VVAFDAEERRLLPIACTLGSADGARRLRDWHSVVTSAGLGWIAEPGRVTLRFRSAAGLGEQLQRLVAAESECCAFLGWSLTFTEGEWQVEVTGSEQELRTLPLIP
jgi:hypothetical protein